MTTDGEAPDDLVAAVVRVLAGWEWEARPSGVVVVGSATRPVLGVSLARQIAEIGRLPVLGSVSRVAGASGRQVNSAQRLKAVWNAFTVGPELAGRLSGQPVLLIDDYTSTGWTLAVVTRLLRRAGAGPVLPLVLGVAG